MKESIEKKISSLLADQKLGVLATAQGSGQPYTSLMAFTYTEDLSSLVVATAKATRKNKNILAQPRVSLLVDNRNNSETDFHMAQAITALGKIDIPSPSERELCRSLYLQRHPFLEDFLNSPSTVIYVIRVYCYLYVSRFQDVMEYHICDEMDLFKK